MTQTRWDDLTECYELFVDWPKRLAHETPFYRRLFDTVKAQRVLDVACGTGHHAALFHSWGMQVEGADLHVGMLDRARRNFGEPPGLQWVCRGFSQPVVPTSPFDVVLCVGNSLSLAADLATARQAVQCMLAATRGGGVVVLHLLNLWRLPDGPCLWQKGLRAELDGCPSVIFKGVHRCGSKGFVDLLVAPSAQPATMRSNSVPFLGLEASTLSQWAREAGAGSVELCGGYQGETYVADASIDLIVIATRDHGH